MNIIQQTVAAVSTPPGKGGIAVIRISGERAVEIASAVFCPLSGKPLAQTGHGRAVFGTVISRGQALDSGIATVFIAPRSYTGEDTVELSCHGGVLITRRVLEAVISAGASLAGAGEFTRRALLNGKLSLTQVEGIGQMLDAISDKALDISFANACGRLDGAIEEIRGKLISLIAKTYVTVDYPDEDLIAYSRGELRDTLNGCSEGLGKLLATYRAGSAIENGVKCAIIGPPNSGKSSLLNALTGYDRAIVSDIPGTTRDTVEEKTVCGDLILRLIDTAGIRESDDKIEREGIERSIKAASSAELILAVFDGASPPEQVDASLNELLRKLPSSHAPIIAVSNKSDLADFTPISDRPDISGVVAISAKSGVGIDGLKREIERLFLSDKLNLSDPVINSARVFAAINAAATALSDAQNALSDGAPPDTVAMDAERAAAALAESTGRTVCEAVVDEIFAKFCVGK